MLHDSGKYIIPYGRILVFKNCRLKQKGPRNKINTMLLLYRCGSKEQQEKDGEKIQELKKKVQEKITFFFTTQVLLLQYNFSHKY